jgi:gamma-glutamylcyclotransferase (GGCT)/AIG2-like uncharacterized protein YtfP
LRGSLALAREPLDAAAVIPPAAAGRDALFFYGTLADADVLAYVLGRPVDLGALAPARLAGFRRVRAAGASYPVLVADAEGSVDGVVLTRTIRRDIVRINHFESGEYAAELREVTLAAGGIRRAWLYAALPGLAASGEPWDLEAWRRGDKAAFFAACDGWMADCPGPD